MHVLALLAPASACAKERCACIAGRAEHALVKTSTSALKLGANAESGLVDRAELEAASTLAGDAHDLVDVLRQACATSCARGCRGCRVARLFNLTLAVKAGMEEVDELGTFIDDERTLTELPRKLNHNAQEAKRVADSLRGLRSHCDHGPGRADRTRAAPRTVEQ